MIHVDLSKKKSDRIFSVQIFANNYPLTVTVGWVSLGIKPMEPYGSRLLLLRRVVEPKAVAINKVKLVHFTVRAVQKTLNR